MLFALSLGPTLGAPSRSEGTLHLLDGGLQAASLRAILVALQLFIGAGDLNRPALLRLLVVLTAMTATAGTLVGALACRETALRQEAGNSLKRDDHDHRELPPFESGHIRAREFLCSLIGVHVLFLRTKFAPIRCGHRWLSPLWGADGLPEKNRS